MAEAFDEWLGERAKLMNSKTIAYMREAWSAAMSEAGFAHDRWAKGCRDLPEQIIAVLRLAAEGNKRLQDWYDGADKERAETGEVGSIHRDNFEAYLDGLVYDAEEALKLINAERKE